MDWNRDGDFYDSGEKVYTGSGSSIVTGQITVPAYAHTGKVRMRISARWSRGSGPCSTFYYGEVEDYNLIVHPSSERTLAIAPEGTDHDTTSDELSPISTLEIALVYPNPVSKEVNKVIVENRSAKAETVSILLRDISGRLIKSTLVNAEEGFNSMNLELSGVEAGMYFIEIIGEENTHTFKLEVI